MNVVRGPIETTMNTEDEFKIRQLRMDDIPVVQAIDRKITQRATTWDNVDVYLAGQPLLSFVAEYRGEVVGFLLGDVKSYEFGLAQSAWIETIGVDPAYQRHGVGGRLVQAFLDHCRRSGIGSVHSLIKENDAGVRTFYEAIGFARGELINMEKTL